MARDLLYLHVDSGEQSNGSPPLKREESYLGNANCSTSIILYITTSIHDK